VTERDRPVLIVGAGAGGLSASTLLAHHGIQSLLIERRREIFVHPKARNLTFRSLEILRGIYSVQRLTRPPLTLATWSASTR
jgi:putative polyketide hydroxylase